MLASSLIHVLVVLIITLNVQYYLVRMSLRVTERAREVTAGCKHLAFDIIISILYQL